LAKSHFPFLASNVAPAHSDPVKFPVRPLVPLRTTLFWAKGKISPSGERPWMYSTPLPSSHRTSPPRGLTHTLSGAFSTSAEGEAKTQVKVLALGS